MTEHQKSIPIALEFQKESNRKVIESVGNSMSRLSERCGGMNKEDKGYNELQEAFTHLGLALDILRSLE